MIITKTTIFIVLCSFLAGIGLGLMTYYMSGEKEIENNKPITTEEKKNVITSKEKEEWKEYKREMAKIAPLKEYFNKIAGGQKNAYCFLNIKDDLIVLYGLGICSDELNLSNLEINKEIKEEEKEGKCDNFKLSKDYDIYEEFRSKKGDEIEEDEEKIKRNDEIFDKRYTLDNLTFNTPKICSLFIKQQFSSFRDETSSYTNDFLVLPQDNLFIQILYRFKHSSISRICKEYELSLLEVPIILIRSFEALKNFWKGDKENFEDKKMFYDSVREYMFTFKARFSLRQSNLSRQMNLIFNGIKDAADFKKFLDYFFRSYTEKYLLYDKVNNTEVYEKYRKCFYDVENLSYLKEIVILENEKGDIKFDLIDFIIFVDRNMSRRVSEFK